MSTLIELACEKREDVGKGASRRLRRLQDIIPGIVYGGKEMPQMITIPQKNLKKALENEAFYSQILSLDIGGKKQKVILRDLQRHQHKSSLLHVDFQRVKDSDKITMKVPLHFINSEICPGVKSGGIISHLIIDVEIKCAAKDIPEFIEVDLSNLGLDESYHLSDLKLGKDMEIPALAQGEDNDAPVVSVHKVRGKAEDDEVAAPVAETPENGEDKKDNASDKEASSDDKGKKGK